MHGPTAGAVPPMRYSDMISQPMTAADPSPIAEAKSALRDQAHARRRAVARAAGADAASALVAVFDTLPRPPASVVVSGYWPMGDEFDPRPLLAALHARGHPCCLPVVIGSGRPLVFRTWPPGDALQAAAFGTSVPPPSAPECEPGLLLVPLLLVDARGYRLGYGGGFYDRTLAGLRTRHGDVLAVGLAFEGQRVERVPTDDTDQRLDWLVTERGAVRFA